MKMSTFERLSKQNKKFNKTIKMECSVLNHHPNCLCTPLSNAYSVFSYFITKYRPTKRTSTHETNIFLIDSAKNVRILKLFELKTFKIITILHDQDDKNDCFLVIIPIQSFTSLQIIPLAPYCWNEIHT